MKRSQGRDLRKLPSVDYRERSSADDLLEVTSEEEELPYEDAVDQTELATENPAVTGASTPFRLAAPLLVIDNVSFTAAGGAPIIPSPDESLADDAFHSAITILEQLSQDSEVLLQASATSGDQTVVEGAEGDLPAEPDVALLAAQNGLGATLPDDSPVGTEAPLPVESDTASSVESEDNVVDFFTRNRSRAPVNVEAVFQRVELLMKQFVTN